MNVHKKSTNLIIIEPKDPKLDDITIALPPTKNISVLAAVYENHHIKVITQTLDSSKVENAEFNNLITNIIAVKKGNDLVVTTADASKVIFSGFYTEGNKDTDDAHTVTLGGGEGEEGITITPNSPVGEVLGDGSFMVYAYADSDVLTDMLTEVDGITLGLSDLPEGTVSYIPTANEEPYLWVASSINTITADNVINSNELTNTLITGTIDTGSTVQLNIDRQKRSPTTRRSYTLDVIATDDGNTDESLTSAATSANTNTNDAPTGLPTITGTATQGETLTAITSSIADADGLGAFSYQWQADGTDILGANNPTLTLTQDQVGKTITVVVSYTDGQDTPETVTSAPTIAVENVNDLTTGEVTITGTAREDQTLTAVTSALRDEDGKGTFTYQWQANGAAISGATNDTLTLTQAQVGKTITVVVIHTDTLGNPEPAKTSAETATVGNVNDPTTGVVTIDGTAAEDQTLTAVTSALADEDGLGTFTYQWQANGAAISGETDNTLTLTQAQVGKTITVVVIHTDTLGMLEPAITSAPTIAVTNVNDLTTGEVTITGTAREDQTLTAVTSALRDEDGKGTFTYQWQANGAAIADATSESLTLTQAQVGKTITVVVIHTDTLGMLEPAITSAPTIAVENVNDLTTGEVTITGTAREDQTLTAVTSALADEDGKGTFTYQWQADGTDIADANNPTLTLTQDQVGKTITVVVIHIDTLGMVEPAITSAPTIAVENVNDLTTGEVTITGTAREDQTLTAVTSALRDEDGLGTFTYQWWASEDDNNEAISGETDNTLILTQDQVGKTITVVVSYTDGQDTPETKTSDPTDAVTNVNDLPTGEVIITGTAREDQTLTAVTSALADEDDLGTLSYQWWASEDDNNEAISGETNDTFTLTQDQVGKTITVVVSYTDGQDTPETKTSDPTDAVTNVNDLPTGEVTITGTAREDQTLTAVTSALADEDDLGTFSYQWWASEDDNNEAISGETDNTLTLTQDQVGKTITVVVSYTDGQDTPETKTSDPTDAVTNVNDLPTGEVTITGTAREDQTLTAVTSALADEDDLGTLSYQWWASKDDNNEAISGETDNTLTLTQDQVGKTITVVVSYTDGQDTPETKTSPPTDAVTNVNDLPTGEVTITGTAREDQTLTAVTSALADEDDLGTLSYQWWASKDDNNEAISGETDNTLTLTQDQVGKTITVVVSYTDGQDTPETKTSDPTDAVTNVNDLPTGEVTITGTAREDQTLTAVTSALADEDDLGTLSYQWWASKDDNNEAISGETDNTLTLTQDQVGKTITVVVSYTDGQDTPETKTSDPTDAVTNVNDLPTGEVTITGTAREDQTLTAVTSALADEDDLGTLSYQWWASKDDNNEAISGETDNTLTLTQDQVGKTITVVVSYTDGQDTPETKTSDPTDAVTNVNDLPTGEVTITGTAREDQTLTAVTSALADEDDLGTFSYQWWASEDDNNEAISGETDNTLTLTQDQVGKTITVVVSYTDGQDTPETKTSDPTDAVTNVNDLPTGEVTITGTAREDQTLTAVTSALADEDDLGTFSYQWWASEDDNNEAISGETDNTLTLTQDQVGKTITVVVSYTDGQDTPETKTSDPTDAVTNVNDLPTGEVTITGTAREDQTLTAVTSALADEDDLGTFSYQWWASEDDNNEAISGETDNTLTLTQDQVGKTITVVVSYTDGQDTPETKTSDPTDAVTNVNDLPTGEVTITGTAREDQTLTAVTSALADEDDLGTFSYQWWASEDDNNEAISGETDNTLTLTQDQVGKTITVVVSYTDGQDTPETKTSDPTDAVTNVNDLPTGEVTITGTAREDQTLTAVTSALADEDDLGTLSYQWWASKDDNNEAISGETDNTLTLTQDQVGKTITVVVSYTDGQDTPETKTSDPTDAVTNVNDLPTGEVTITGTAREDQTLTAVTSALADEDDLGTLSYQWWASEDDNNEAISGETNDTLTLTQDQVGKTITVVVSYTDGQDTPETKTSDPTDAVTNVNDLPTGEVTITGTAREDQTLTAVTSALADEDDLGTLSYQWWASKDDNNEAISGETDNTLTLTQDQVGKTITVVVSYTDGQDTPETKTSDPTDAVTNVNDLPTGEVTITGTAREDQTLTAVTSALADEDDLGTLSYQWWASKDDNNEAISGETDNTLTLTQDQVGKTITVVVSYTDGQDTPETKTSDPTDAVTNVNDLPTGEVTITGTAREDQTLTAVTSALADEDDLGTLSYQWWASKDDNNEAISGETDNTLTLTQDQVGKTITVVVSYTDGQDTPETKTSDPTDAVTNVNDLPTGEVTITGTAREDQTLTAVTSALADEDDLGTLSYQWWASKDDNNEAISGETDNTLTLTQDQVGKTITVVVSYTDGQDTPETKTSDPTDAVTNVNDLPTGEVTITGTAREDQTLTAVTSALADEDDLGTLSYQWWASKDDNNEAISGETDNTLTLTQDQVGKTITVVVSYTDGQDTPETKTSDPTDAVTNVNDLPTGEVTITGTAREDQTLTAVTSALADEDDLGTLSYQWWASKDDNNEAISGETDNTLTLTQDQVGKTITVVVSYTDGQDTPETKTSDPTDAVTNVNDLPTGEVTITGTAREDQTLTAVTSALADEDDLGTLSYQWWASKDDNNEAISGETDNTLTLTQDQVGKTITVVVSYTDGQDTPETKTSDPTDAVTNVNDLPTGEVTITGTAREDQTLTAVTSALADEDDLGTLSYQWWASKDDNNEAISDATDNTLTLTQDQVGKTITVVVSYTDGQDTPETKTSDPTDAVTNVNDLPTGEVTITGTAREDQTLTAVTSALADEDDLGTLSYQWWASKDDNNEAISGETDNTLTLTQDQVGKTITVVVSYTDGQDTPETKTSDPTDAVTNVNDLPTGEVTITGTAREDQTLTAVTSALADEDDLGTLSYQWWASKDDNNEAISDATDNTLTLTQDQVGKTITVVVSYTDGQDTPETKTSDPTDAVTNVNDLPTGEVTITGTAREDQTLTAVTSALADEDDLGTLSYQWWASKDDNNEAISGETDNTLTLTQDQVGKTITVVVSYTDGQDTPETKTSDPTDAVTNVNDLPTGEVTITGTAREDQTLTAVTSALADEDDLGTFSYQWWASEDDNNEAISGETNDTLTLTQDQVGKTITVVVSYTDGQDTPETKTSDPTDAVTNVNDLPTGEVTITGTAREDQTLTAVTSALADEDDLGTLSYQWWASEDDNNEAISGETDNTLTLTQDQVGKTITVVVSYTDGQDTPETKTSDPTDAVTNVNDLPTGEVTITGTAREDQTLTAVTSALADEDDLGTLSYQWWASEDDNNEAISGETDNTLTLTQDQVGKTITVVVSYTDGQDTPETKTSPPTDAVTNVNDLPTGEVTITGTAREDQTLTAVTSALADEDDLGTLSYQWWASEDDNNEAISGETDNTLTLTQDQVGKTITVVVSYTDGQDTPETKTSDPTDAVTNVNDLPTGEVTITGTAREDQTLTAVTSALADEDDLGTLSYQWWASEDDNNEAISGETDNTLTLTQDQVGKTITVVVSYTDGQDTPETKTSDPTDAVTNVNDLPTGEVTITGTAREDQTLTAVTSALADEDDLGTFSYQWWASEDDNNEAISGETDNTLTLTQDQVGKTITVVVSYTDGQDTPETKTSDPTDAVTNVNDLPTGEVTITGTAREYQTLTAVTSALADEDDLGTFTYQWWASEDDNNEAISGETDNTLTLTQDQVGKTITVVVSYTDGQDTPETKTSPPTDAVTNVNDLPTGEVTITGTAREDQTLTAVTSALADEDDLGTLSYQWWASKDDNNEAISGETDNTLTLTQDQVGKTITVVVSYTDGQDTPETKTSDPTDAVTNVNDLPTGEVTITGTAREDQTLTAVTSALADEDDLGTFTYQWWASEDDNNEAISGETDNTLTLTQDQVGKTITVVVTYTDGQRHRGNQNQSSNLLRLLMLMIFPRVKSPLREQQEKIKH